MKNEYNQPLLSLNLNPIETKMEIPELFDTATFRIPRDSARTITIRRRCAICGAETTTLVRMTRSTIFENASSHLCETCKAKHS